MLVVTVLEVRPRESVTYTENVTVPDAVIVSTVAAAEVCVEFSTVALDVFPENV